MSYNFPTSPTEGQEFTPAGSSITYVFNEPRWKFKGTDAAAIPLIVEAPDDGIQYGRQSNSWTEILVNPTWATLSGKPATFPPTVPIAYADVSGKPATFPPTLPIPYADVSGKPSTFPPTLPIPWTDVSGKPVTFPPVLPIAWTDVSGKPTTFPPTVPIEQVDINGLVASLTARVLKAGDTMTGNLVISTGGSASIALNATSGTPSNIVGQVAFNPRWNLKLGDEAVESGGNAGSNFILNRYDDNGAGGAAAMQINRASKATTFYADVTTTGSFFTTIGAFISNDVNVVLANTGVGNVFFRPNGYGSTTNQVSLSGAGVMTLATTPTAGDNTLKAATTAFVTTAVANRLTDANSDGKYYLRKDGAWVESPFTIDAGGDAIIKIGATIVVRIKPSGLALFKDDIEVFSVSI